MRTKLSADNMLDLLRLQGWEIEEEDRRWRWVHYDIWPYFLTCQRDNPVCGLPPVYFNVHAAYFRRRAVKRMFDAVGVFNSTGDYWHANRICQPYSL